MRNQDVKTGLRVRLVAKPEMEGKVVAPYRDKARWNLMLDRRMGEQFPTSVTRWAEEFEPVPYEPKVGDWVQVYDAGTRWTVQHILEFDDGKRAWITRTVPDGTTRHRVELTETLTPYDGEND